MKGNLNIGSVVTLYRGQDSTVEFTSCEIGSGRQRATTPQCCEYRMTGCLLLQRQNLANFLYLTLPVLLSSPSVVVL